MKSCKYFQLIILLTILSNSLSQKCNNKCISCMPQGCYRCKYRMTLNSLQCGDRIDSIVKYCEVMMESEKPLCSQCAETYALSRDRKSCVKTKISRCRIAHIDNMGVERCTACIDSQPNSSNTACRGDLKISYCTYGGRNLLGGLGCVNCDSGYNFNKMGKCFEECTEGCLTCIGGNCLACNHFRGFYDVNQGVCRESGMIWYASFLGIFVIGCLFFKI